MKILILFQITHKIINFEIIPFKETSHFIIIRHLRKNVINQLL